ncbi:MAG: hypothetical protein ACJ76F_12185 [Bacteroidia bacterium]
MKMKSVVFLVVNFNFLLSSAASDSLLLKKTGNPSLVLFSIAYSLPVNQNKVISSGHGISTELGINPGKYFGKNILLGIYGGYGWRDNFWNTSFNKNFVSDYQASFKDVKLPGLDSAVIHSAGNLFAEKKGTSPLSGCETKAFHNYSLHYGIFFKLPHRYFPAVKIYRGATHTSFRATEVITHNRDYNLYEIRSAMQGIELVFFQGKTWRSTNKETGKLRVYNAAALSFYYERCNFYRSRLYFSDGVDRTTIPFSAFLSDQFSGKYKSVPSFGFKLSFIIS